MVYAMLSFTLLSWNPPAWIGALGLLLILTLALRHVWLFMWLRWIYRVDAPSPMLWRSVKRMWLADAGSRLLRKRLLSYQLTPQHTAYSHHLILGPDGSGKTRLLLQLHLYNHLSWRRRSWRTHYISLTSPDALQRIQGIANPKRTILLLDGLDEDPAFIATPRIRLDEILHHTYRMARVVVSCHPGMWPGSLHRLAEGEAVRYTGERTAQLWACYELPIRRGSQPPAPKVPVLACLMDISQSISGMSGFQTARLDKWLEAAEPGTAPKIRTASAQAFWQAVAQLMLARARQQRGATLSLSHVQGLHQRHAAGWELNTLLSEMMWKDRQGRYRWVHACFWAYFATQHAAMPQDSLAAICQYIPRGRQYTQERAWQRLWAHSSVEAPVEVRTRQRSDRHALSEIAYEDVLEVTRVYLPQRLVQAHFDYLPTLSKLKGVYIEGIDRQRLPAELIEALPHNEVWIYLHTQGRIQQVIGFRETQAALESPSRPSQHIAAIGLTQIDLFTWPPPRQPFIPPTGRQVGKDTRLLEVLPVELQFWLQQLMGMPPEGEGAYEHFFPHTLWGLFNRARCYYLPENDTYTLVLDQTFSSTLIDSELASVLDRFVEVMGEDDRHLRAFGADDLAQIADGHWQGRRWLWGNTDRYTFPVHLFMAKAGFATLIMWGLKRQHLAQLQMRVQVKEPQQIASPEGS